jgi:site-specific DNA recombinase
VVEQIVLESMQRILLNVQAFEKEFARKQMDCYTEDKKKQLAAKRRELSKAKKRIAGIDALIQKIYEDNAAASCPMSVMPRCLCPMRRNRKH